jgi:hypothetical protein
MNLVRAAAWHFPTFKKRPRPPAKGLRHSMQEDLTPEDVDALLNFAFERYFETSGLFGTPRAAALHMVNRLKEIGVDDIACLIDFGVPSSVLEHLDRLNELKKLAASPRVPAPNTRCRR